MNNSKANTHIWPSAKSKSPFSVCSAPITAPAPCPPQGIFSPDWCEPGVLDFLCSFTTECIPEHGFDPAHLWAWTESFCVLSFFPSMPSICQRGPCCWMKLGFIHSCCSNDYIPQFIAPNTFDGHLGCFQFGPLGLQQTFWDLFSDHVRSRPRSRAAKSWRIHGLNS